MKTSISFEIAIRLVHIEVIDFQTTTITTSLYMMHREAVTFRTSKHGIRNTQKFRGSKLFFECLRTKISNCHVLDERGRRR